MAAEIVKIAPDHPERAFSRAREVIGAGGVIVYPTETFYGLGADPRNPAAIKRLFEIKGRPAGQPILLLIRDAAEVGEWASSITQTAERLMKRFWPGPLTLVFQAQPHVLRELTAETGKIGLRIPGSPMTRSLLQTLGAALTGTSANISGGPSPVTAEDAAAALKSRVDLILDGGRTAGGKPSTVVDVSAHPPGLIREGSILFHDILSHIRAIF